MAFKEAPAYGTKPAAGRGQDAVPTTPSRPWLVTCVVLIAAFMELLDVTILNVAIPSIRSGLHASDGELQWMAAGYQLTFAVALMTGGRLGDIYGRKRMFLTGVTFFTLASAFCGVALSPGMLIAGRVVQGLSSALMLPQVLSTIHVSFPAEKRQAAFAVFGSVVGIASLAGPLVGGLVITANLFSLHWRPVFLLNIPLGIVAVIGALLFLPDAEPGRRQRLDVQGTALAAAGAFLVIFPVIQGRAAGWAPWTWVCLAASVPVFAAFAVLQRRKTRENRSPLLDTGLFRQRGFVAGLLVTLVFFGGVASFSFVFMITMQVGHSYSALRAGLAVFPLALAAGVGSGLSAGLAKAVGTTVLQIGAAFCVGGMVWLSIAISVHSVTLSPWDMVAPLVVAGVGLGMVLAPLTDIVLAGTKLSSTGSASGMLSTMIQFGGAVGVAVVGTIFFSLIGGHATATVSDVTPQLHHELAMAGLSPARAGAIETAFRSCFHERANAQNATVVPPGCRQLTARSAGNARAGAAVASAGVTALRKDFSGAMARSLYYQIAVFAAVFLLVFLLPRVSKSDLERVVVADR
jgi:EmrB/QacA subfamily drug resistance transporter